MCRCIARRWLGVTPSRSRPFAAHCTPELPMLLTQSQIQLAIACLLPLALAETVAMQTRTGPLPNVAVQTQDGRSVRFHDDLIKDKVVLINFMVTSRPDQCAQATANLAEVAAKLGDRLGPTVRMISLTVDPTTDTPGVLRAYADRYAEKPGWYFVTGRREDLDAIRVRLGVREDATDPARDSGMLIYGDDATGRWATMPALSQPETIVRRVMPLVARRAGSY
ncbi:MAG TPA: SCO family protein [Vicinamibacterales bacterium]|nr:SCO family protein [Vicinamibacterales bacterium]